MKTIEDLYEGVEITECEDGTYTCPVCSKVYKQKRSAVSHLSKRDCHSVYDIFGDTPYEQKAFVFYSNIQSLKNPKARPTMRSFRKSSLYKNTVMYTVSCMANEVDHGLMYSFLEEIVGFSFPNKILKEGQDMKWVMAYREFIHNNPEVSESGEYYEKYKDVLLEDDDFLIQSIEKAHISLGWVESNGEVLDRLEELPVGYRMRLMDVLKMCEESKW